MRRLLVSAGIVLAASASFLLAPAGASAVTGPQIVASAIPANVVSSQPVSFSYTINSDTDYSNAVLTVALDTALSYVSATVDGATATLQPAVPPVPGSYSIVVSAGTTPAATQHTVVLQATAPTASGTVHTTSTASLSFSDAAHPTGTSIAATPLAIAVNAPDIAVSYPADSGQDGILPLSPGGVGALDVLVTNNGSGSRPTTLFVDLPTGLTLDGGVFTDTADINCAVVPAIPARLGCDLGAIPAGTTVDVGVPVTTTAAAVLGQTVTLTVSAQPTDPAVADPNQANNSKTATITFVSAPHLVPTISPAATQVAIGSSTKLTLTVRNAGAGAASFAAAVAVLENTHFAMTGFDGAELDLSSSPGPTGSGPGSGSGSGGGIQPVGGGRVAGEAGLRAALAARTLGSPRSARNNGKGAAAETPAQFARRELFASLRASRASASATVPAPATPGGPTGDTLGPDMLRAWDLGQLAPGAVLTAHLTVTARSAGTSRLGIAPVALPADPACDSQTATVPADCFAIATLTAVVAPPAAPRTQRVAPAAGAGPVLANTGSSSISPSLIALALIALGAAALWIGRRRA